MKLVHTLDWTMWAANPRRAGAGVPVGVFDSERDATNALHLAERFSQQCWVGRRSAYSKVSDPFDYMIGYWKAPTGKTSAISPEHCLTYDPRQLRVIEQGTDVWVVTDGGQLRLKFVDKETAAAARDLVSKNTAYCSIGLARRVGTRNLSRFDYWK